MATDPVCKTTIDESKAAGKSEFNGKTYYFCAAGCKTKFDANPQLYLKDRRVGPVHESAANRVDDGGCMAMNA